MTALGSGGSIGCIDTSAELAKLPRDWCEGSESELILRGKMVPPLMPAASVGVVALTGWMTEGGVCGGISDADECDEPSEEGAKSDVLLL